MSDVDGVLTDGGLYYGHGGMELKRFCVHDGLAIALARRAGVMVFLASGRSSSALRRRARELKVERVWQGAADKRRVFAILVKKYHLAPSEICCLGDDLPDLPLLKRAGLSAAVPNAAVEVRRAAAFVTRRRGGEGALREVVELIVKARGRWREMVRAYEA